MDKVCTECRWGQIDDGTEPCAECDGFDLFDNGLRHENAKLREQVERLKVCGTCVKWSHIGGQCLARYGATHCHPSHTCPQWQERKSDK